MNGGSRVGVPSQRKKRQNQWKDPRDTDNNGHILVVNDRSITKRSCQRDITLVRDATEIENRC